MRFWEYIETIERDGIEYIVESTPEDMQLEDSFDDSIDPDTGKPYFDIPDMYRQIEHGHLMWFILRVRAFVGGHEFGSANIGGLLYETDKVYDVFKDGIVEDLIWEAERDAKAAIAALKPVLETVSC
jgi:hypothetical protein